jgi:hypothetical protein
MCGQSTFTRLSNWEGWERFLKYIYIYIYIYRVSGVREDGSVKKLRILNWWVLGFKLKFFLIDFFWNWVNVGAYMIYFWAF